MPADVWNAAPPAAEAIDQSSKAVKEIAWAVEIAF
jgi:hypothetical protein